MVSGRKGKAFRTRMADLLLQEDTDNKSSSNSLFIWTIIILLLAGFAFGCWIFSFYIFGHPEKALSYSILTHVKKLEPPKRFEITAAPRGKFLTAAQLWEQYSPMTDRELQRTSEVLLRNYLRNYKLTQDLVPYIIGSFSILDSYELGSKTFFPSGVIALAQSTGSPYVLLEQVFTADKQVVSMLQRMLLTGFELHLEKNLDLSAIINAKRLQDGRLLFTAIPILYGSYAASAGTGTFSLEPPTSLDIVAGLPIVNGTIISEADQKYTAFRTKSKNLKVAQDASLSPQSQLVRVERPEISNEVTQNVPVLPAKQPEVRRAVLATSQSSEEAPPAAIPVTTPTASIATTAGGNWATYTSDQMPSGRLIGMANMPDLAAQGIPPDERIYLQGNFTVTASGQNRAVLRPITTGADPAIDGLSANARVIVEFHANSRPPAEGANILCDSQHPLLITQIRKTADGQINVYAREITRD